MHWFVISIALQLLCIVHVFRTGRNTAWIMAIAFLPMVGVLAYLIRVFGGYPDGVAFAVLLFNIATPLIDLYTQPSIFGMKEKS